MRPDQLRSDSPRHPWPPAAWGIVVGWSLVTGTAGATAQIPPPGIEPTRAPDLIARRAAILQHEQTRLASTGTAKRLDFPPATPGDGSTRFVPLAEVVAAADLQANPNLPPAEVAIRRDSAAQLFDLAMVASRTGSPPLAFIDDCLRATLARQPDHAEARRLLGFVPHGGKGWATPWAARQLAMGQVKDPTFGWVPGDWVAHLARNELPAPTPLNRWLPTADADALRVKWPGWTISTEHFEIHANVPLAEAITFGRQLETLHQLFGSIMADLIGRDQLPLAQRLRTAQLSPSVSKRPKHVVNYFATRAEYIQYLAPIHNGARESLGIYLPRKEFRKFGGISYFFKDVGGQLDVSATLYHEVSHQLLFESAGPDNYARNTGNFWVFEGLGTYFETLRHADDGSVRIGGLVGPRIAAAKKRLIDQRDFVPLEPFARMARGAFLGDGGGDIYLHYAEAMALAVFLMQADSGRYREPFLDYARDAYTGQFRGDLGRALDNRLDRPYPDLERELLAYLARYQPPASP